MRICVGGSELDTKAQALRRMYRRDRCSHSSIHTTTRARIERLQRRGNQRQQQQEATAARVEIQTQLKAGVSSCIGDVSLSTGRKMRRHSSSVGATSRGSTLYPMDETGSLTPWLSAASAYAGGGRQIQKGQVGDMPKAVAWVSG